MSFRRFSRRLARSWPPAGPALVAMRSVDSTNSFARRVAAACRLDGEVPAPTAFLAHRQSGGRGRGDHRWESPAGHGVYASLLLPAVPARRLGALPLLAGLGLVEGLRPLVGAVVHLRWPNDLLIGERKLGGVLIESASVAGGDATVVVGFGINYLAVPVEGSTSIAEHALKGAGRAEGEPERLADVARCLVTAVCKEVDGLDDIATAARRYAAASVHRRGDRLSCRTPSGLVEGRFRGFDERGFLRLDTDDGERSMGCGDLIWAGEAR